MRLYPCPNIAPTSSIILFENVSQLLAVSCFHKEHETIKPLKFSNGKTRLSNKTSLRQVNFT